VTPLVIAHRGASWDAPENTLAAFEHAIAVGADFVELDVHAARDGELVVVHDAPRATLAELRARRPEVPTLDEVVAALRGRIGVMVELKRPYAYRGRDVVRRTLELLDDDAVVISFEARALEDVQRLRPEVRTVQHVGFGVSMRRAARYAWAVGFHDARATRRAITRARSLGLETTVYTVNDPARMRELAALGVSGIFSDRPDLLRRTLAGS